MGAGILLTGDISVILTYGVRGRECVIRKLIVFCYCAYKRCRALPCGELLSEECVEYRSRGVKRLKLVLNVKSREYIVGVSNGKVRGVGLVRSFVLVGIRCGDNFGVSLHVVLSKTVGC